MATWNERKQAKQSARRELKRQRAQQIENMTEREKKAWGFGCLGVLALIVFFLVRGCSSLSPTEGASPSSLKKRVEGANGAPSCPGVIKALDYAVAREAVIQIEPREGAASLVWKVGADNLPATIDGSFAVRQQCRFRNWSQIRVLGPQGQRGWVGWVQTRVLRKVPVTASGRRIYQVSDFTWPGGSKASKIAAVEVMNRIMAQRPDCEALDISNLVSKGGGGHELSIPCNTANGMVSFDFSDADAASGRSFGAVSRIGKIDAINACKQVVQARASHPSSVIFPVLDYDYERAGTVRRNCG